VHHFHTKEVDGQHITCDDGVEVEFDQYTCFGLWDMNIIEGKFDTLKRYIMQVDFSSFQYIFKNASGGILKVNCSGKGKKMEVLFSLYS
jgi:hypothetical protein